MPLLSPSLEDYLEEIYRLSLNQRVVRASDVAIRLKVTMPSVNNALRRLGQDAYVIYVKYRDIVLTDKGVRLGQYLVERNHILQKFFATINPASDAPAEAEAMEHYLSYSSIRAIEDLLDYWQTYPGALERFREHARNRQQKSLGVLDGYQN